MELTQIKEYLDSPNPQNRMKAIVELRHHEPSVVVPLLKQKMYDKEFVVRSFVAMGLGYKRNEEAFQSLLDIIEYEKDPNVRAEAANSLSKYGEQSTPYLMELFRIDSNWLVRQSIFAVMNELESPEILFQLSQWGLQGDDLVVKFIAIDCFARLKGTKYEEEAIAILCELANSEIAQIRIKVAKALGVYDDPRAKVVLAELRNDENHRVVAAALESMV